MSSAEVPDFQRPLCWGTGLALPRRVRRTLIWLSLLLLGCAGNLESAAVRDLNNDEFPRARAAEGQSASRPQRAEFDGSLERYVAYALEHNPELEAQYEEFRAATHRISRARRLPEPTLTYTYFARGGPQRHGFGISQAFPWPTKLSAGADASALAAQSAKRQFEASALRVSARVSDAYWELWLVSQVRRIQKEQLVLSRTTSDLVRSRLEIGAASLADVSQTDLVVSRATDVIAGLDEAERRSRAALRTALGAPDGMDLPVHAAAPRLMAPAESDSALVAAAQTHPGVGALELMAHSKSSSAESSNADRYPSFVVGLEYIETGPAKMPNQADSGEDAVMVMLGVKLPLWGSSYSDEVDAARADSASFKARAASARNDARARVDVVLSEIRDALRRAKLYQHTLVPQATTALKSVIGSYAAGRATLPQLLIAQRELLEIELSLAQARAVHARAWARLEDAVGRRVRAKEVS